MKFKDLPLKSYFRLTPEGRSFQKTSYFGYYVDSCIGEMQVQSELEVIPFDAPTEPEAPKVIDAKIPNC
jgi:hypothetical protein